MRFVRTTKPKAAAAARIGAALAHRKRAELLELLRPCFARTEPWLQEHVDAFDADIRDMLLGVDPSGIFSQDVTFGAWIARR
jgi:uncharacterized protein with von Willebrand factor type A (vWA) domain